jgi:hypothetical protein
MKGMMRLQSTVLVVVLVVVVLVVVGIGVAAGSPLEPPGLSDCPAGLQLCRAWNDEK